MEYLRHWWKNKAFLLEKVRKKCKKVRKKSKKDLTTERKNGIIYCIIGRPMPVFVCKYENGTKKRTFQTVQTYRLAEI